MTTEVERMKLDIDLPPVEVLEEINYLIVTEANKDEVFAKLKEANIDPVLFSLTDEDYELLQKNNVRMRNQIIKYIAIIEAYKEYYEPEENESDSKPFTATKFEPKKFNKED